MGLVRMGQGEAGAWGRQGLSAGWPELPRCALGADPWQSGTELVGHPLCTGQLQPVRSSPPRFFGGIWGGGGLEELSVGAKPHLPSP